MGGFFANQPNTIRITDCRNILGGEGSTDLSFGGVFGGIPDNTSLVNWNITNLVSQFALIVAPITINVVNGTATVACKNCYGSPLHKTPILYTYTYCNKTETDSFVLDWSVWYLGNDKLPYLKTVAAGPWVDQQTVLGIWGIVGIAIGAFAVGGLLVFAVMFGL